MLNQSLDKFLFMNSNLISIIIPTFNRGNLIVKTLDSIISQTCTNWECIIVDDGSNDDTVTLVNEISRKDKRVKIYNRPNNLPKGANSCRNYGFELSQGKFIQWFDSDDLMASNLLSKQLENIKNNNSNISICNFSFFRTKDNLFDFAEFNNLGSRNQILNDFIGGEIVLNTQTALFKKEFLKFPLFNLELHRAQDLDFMYRSVKNNKNSFSILKEKLVFVRRHDDSITSNFMSRNIQLIHDEIEVRAMIWTDFEKSNMTIRRNGALKMYLQSLKYLLYKNKYISFFKRSIPLFLNVDNYSKLIILRLNLIVLFFIFTKKGITKYQHTINKLLDE
jgi:glycosyltransferase involved in cell wall biosynthesis